jgi:ABC-type antimicrobial peptide transport system permease subunit
MRRTLRLAVAGIALGVPAALIAARLFGSFLFGVTGNEPVAFLVAASALGLIAIVAGYVPARRATRVDPLTALRSD